MNFQGITDEYMLYGRLFALTNRIQTIGDGQFKDITMKQHFLLICLEVLADESPTLKKTASLMGCSYQNVKRMALHLEKNGYLKIEQDETDKRRLNLVMTRKVETLKAQMQEATQQFMEQLYLGISADELAAALRILTKMENNLVDAPLCRESTDF